ncbi:hypothetical protein EYF80_054936 [Liparis tanakae]|uniref:Uncharacterized protein n=1 Tax=Liparis tanakae TaxID=230148 RepID=A0A4Z2F116_9TELE|nr:hypothetical protein EYF80_054936 [Liparis tanakae]
MFVSSPAEALCSEGKETRRSRFTNTKAVFCQTARVAPWEQTRTRLPLSWFSSLWRSVAPVGIAGTALCV